MSPFASHLEELERIHATPAPILALRERIERDYDQMVNAQAYRGLYARISSTLTAYQGKREEQAHQAVESSLRRAQRTYARNRESGTFTVADAQALAQQLHRALTDVDAAQNAALRAQEQANRLVPPPPPTPGTIYGQQYDDERVETYSRDDDGHEYVTIQSWGSRTPIKTIRTR